MYKISTESIGDLKKYVWHYRKDNKEYGPYTYEDIIEKVKKCEIGPDDYVLKFGNKKFVKVSEVQGLFEVITQPEKKKEEKISMAEEQVVGSKEDTKEEFQVVFEKRTSHIQTKHKKESSSQKIAMIIVGLMGLGLAVWILIRLL